jgi:precorrin-8X/cobalt-precorrin-8 methylmutase
VPAIAAMGRKGGSTVAAAVCNALVYSAAEMQDPAARGWK